MLDDLVSQPVMPSAEDFRTAHGARKDLYAVMNSKLTAVTAEIYSSAHLALLRLMGLNMHAARVFTSEASITSGMCAGETPQPLCASPSVVL
jgi:hypothetical protein